MASARSRLEASSDPRLAALGVRSLDDVFAIRGLVVNSDRRSEVLRIETPAGALYLKRFRYAGLVRRLFRLGAASHCRREAENLVFMRALGVACPEVLAWGEERALGLPRRAFLATAAVAGARTLEELLDEGALPAPRRRRLAAELAAGLARLHAAGYLDRDWKFRNVLVAEDGTPVKLDSPRGRRFAAPLSDARAALDLGMLLKHAPRHLAPREILRFLAVYARARALDRERTRRLARLARARAALLHRRGGTA